MTIAAYYRVSSNAQDLEMQRTAVEKRCKPDLVYSEKRSAKTTKRAEFQRLMADVRAGKITELYIFRLDRLARSGVSDTFKTIAELRRAGVTLFSVSDGVVIRPDTDDIVSETLVFALSLAAKLEHTAITERVHAARERKLAKGEHWGRPHRMTPGDVERARALQTEGRSVRAIAMALKIPRATVARALQSAAA